MCLFDMQYSNRNHSKTILIFFAYHVLGVCVYYGVIFLWDISGVDSGKAHPYEKISCRSFTVKLDKIFSSLLFESSNNKNIREFFPQQGALHWSRCGHYTAGLQNMRRLYHKIPCLVNHANFQNFILLSKRFI